MEFFHIAFIRKDIIMKKRILFILPTLCGGGAEKTVANLSNYLSKKYEVFIAVFRDTPTKYNYSGNLLVLNNRKNYNIIDKIIFTFKSISKLKRLKKNLNINYSISFLTTADMLNILSKTKESKTIVSIRNTDSIYNMGLSKLMTYFSCRFCDKIVSISNQVKDDLIDNFRIDSQKIKVIYNPALKIGFSDNKMVDNTLFSEKTIINLGRLTKQKGQWHLIRSFTKVVKKYPSAKLIILGDGELKEYLNNLIKSYKLENNVYLLGFVNNPYDYIKKSSIFVFSSQYEGLGNSILEAMLCKIPIISTDCVSGPREILAPHTNYKNKIKSKIDYTEYGVLVPTCDNELHDSNDPLTKEEILLSDAIIKLISDEKMKEKYSKLSYERSKDFNIIKIVNEWESFLEEE